MKFETKNFTLNRERWGKVQSDAKHEEYVRATGITDMAIQDPNAWMYGDPVLLPPDQLSGHQWVTTTVVGPQSQSAQINPLAKTVAELELLRDSLNHCVVCGTKDVFVFCALCREAVKDARKKYVDEGLESMRPQ